MDEDDSSIPPTKTGRRKKDASRGDLVRALSNEIVAAIRELVQLNPLYREHMQYFTQRVDICVEMKLQFLVCRGRREVLLALRGRMYLSEVVSKFELKT